MGSINPIFITLVILLLLDDFYSTVILPFDYKPQLKKVKAVNNPGYKDKNKAPLYLTNYIEDGKLKEAREASRVKDDHFIQGVESYSGYFTVNKEYDSNLFFWYFPAQNQPVDTSPWFIWLQGGPGWSSMTGLFTEIGPYYVTNDGQIHVRNTTWGKDHSLLFIDSPAGTGFSFTEDDKGYATNEIMVGETLYSAVQQFLTVFPELREAPLIVTGESYAGKYIPSLSIQIHWNRDKDQPINLKGLAIGNGFIDPVTLQRYSYFLREVGMVDDHVADQIKDIEDTVVKYINDGDMVQAYNAWEYILGNMSKHTNLSSDNLYNFLSDNSLDRSYVAFLNREEVQDSIHVGYRNFEFEGQKAHDALVPDFMNTTKPWLEELIQNYKVLCYSGQLDMIVPYHASANTYRSLKYPGSDDWNTTERRPWYSETRLAGYVKTLGNFSEVMVRGSGHMVPTDQPEAALEMISSFARAAAGDTKF